MIMIPIIANATDSTLEQLLVQFFWANFWGVFIQYAIPVAVACLAPFIILLALCWKSPALSALKAKWGGTVWLLTVISAGKLQPRLGKYKHGLFRTKQGYHTALSDGSDIITCKGTNTGIALECYGNPIAPYKVAAINFWTGWGFNGLPDAQLFHALVQCRGLLLPEEVQQIKQKIIPQMPAGAKFLLAETNWWTLMNSDAEAYPGMTYKHLYERAKKVSGITDDFAFYERLESFKERMPHIPNIEQYRKEDLPPVFWNGGGLFANIAGYVVNYFGIKGWMDKQLNPSYVTGAIKTEGNIASLNTQKGEIVKYVGIGIMVVLVLVGVGILLKVTGMV